MSVQQQQPPPVLVTPARRSPTQRMCMHLLPLHPSVQVQWHPPCGWLWFWCTSCHQRRWPGSRQCCCGWITIISSSRNRPAGAVSTA